MLLLVNPPLCESKPMCATWEKPLGALIIALVTPPPELDFLLPMRDLRGLDVPPPPDDLEKDAAEVPPYFLANLCRCDTFLYSSLASSSLANAIPIMHSCAASTSRVSARTERQLQCSSTHIAWEAVEEGAILPIRHVLLDRVLPNHASCALFSAHPLESAHVGTEAQSSEHTARSTTLIQPPLVPQPKTTAPAMPEKDHLVGSGHE